MSIDLHDFELALVEEWCCRGCGKYKPHTAFTRNKRANVNKKELHNFELQLTEPCLAMTQRGLRVDEDVRAQMIRDLTAGMDPLAREVNRRLEGRLEGRLFERKWVCSACRNGKRKRLSCPQCNGVGRQDWHEFNLASEKQQKLVLYKFLKLPRRTKQGKLRSDEDALKSLLLHDETGVVRALLDFGKMETMRSILARLKPAEDGRIRCWYNIAGTETGRFSASETFLERSTNLQNLPLKQAARSPLFDVRRCIVPDDGEVFLYADLSQAEARVVAALAGDRSLLERWDDPAFDVHRWTAAHIFGKPDDEVTSDERFLGKTARHALNYGESWATFQRKVNGDADITGVAIDAPTAKRIVTGYHRLHPRLESWWRQVGDRLDRTGRLTTCFGRTRTFFARREADHWLDACHREAIAYEPQSTVADLLNRGLLRFWRLYDGDHGMRLLAQVHDAILVGARSDPADLEFSAQAVTGCLEEEIEVNGVHLTIPCEVEVGKRSWAELEELEVACSN